MTAATKSATTNVRPSFGTSDLPSSHEGGAASAALLSQLRDLGRTLDDVERARIQVGNRLAALTRGEDFADIGMPTELTSAFDLMLDAEAGVVRAMEKTWRRHPLYAWSRHVPGVGDKSIARLLAEIGDPTLRPVGHFEDEDEITRRFVVDDYEPRKLSQLAAYCGHGDPNRRKRASRNGSGMTQAEAMRLGNPVAKKRVWLIASAGIKQRCPACREAAREREDSTYIAPPADCTCAETHPLRHAYDRKRREYAERVHDEGARVGEPWTAAHQHAAAIRYVGKTFLKMLHQAAQGVSS